MKQTSSSELRPRQSAALVFANGCATVGRLALLAMVLRVPICKDRSLAWSADPRRTTVLAGNPDHVVNRIPVVGVLAFVRWDVRPEIVAIGPVVVRWYGLFFMLAFLAGFAIVRWMYRVEGKRERDLEGLLVWMMAGALIGARLGHCLFYDPAYYWNHPLEIVAVWNGGLASHGGAVGILVALYFYARQRPDQPYGWLLDRIAVPAALGGACIRVGNLFNSEILGRRTTVPWAFVFARVDNVPRHPVQVYEAIGYALIFLLLLTVYQRGRGRTAPGLLFGLFLVMVFAFRFMMEFLKQRQEAYQLPGPLTMGQLLSVPFIVGGLVLLWRARTGGR